MLKLKNVEFIFDFIETNQEIIFLMVSSDNTMSTQFYHDVTSYE